MMMLLRWGLKTLWFHKATSLGSMLGITFSFLLAMFFASVWLGETEQIVAYPKKMNPDLWVMQKGVANMHMAMSFVWDWKADAIEKLPEVQQVTPFVYVTSVIHLKNQKMFGFVVGLLSPSSRAGPWQLTRGRMITADDEVIVPEALSAIYGVEFNDVVQIVDQGYRIVGFSEGTYSSANPVFFTLKDRLEDSIQSFGTYSYLLVDAHAGVDIKSLRQKILNKVEKVSVLTQAEFIKNDIAMASQMGAEIILVMTLICIGLASLIVGYSSYSLVIKKQKEIAIIKAMGASRFKLLMTIIIQAVIISLPAYFVAVLIMLVLEPIIPNVAPQITLSLNLSLLLQPALLVIVIAVIGSIYPAIKILRLDPAVAYKIG